MVLKFITNIKKALTKEPGKKFEYDMAEVAKLYKLATIDTKTQLFNFRHFETEMKREISLAERYKRPISLLLLDIDDFKSVNDRYGYKMGDEMLKKVASIIRGDIRDTDTPARFGGEEFTVLLPETGSDSAKKMAERLRELVLDDVFLKSYRLTVSIGISSEANGASGDTAQNNGNFVSIKSFYKQFMPKNNPSDKLDLFDKANIALRYAKKHGKNQSVVFSPVMNFQNVDSNKI